MRLELIVARGHSSGALGSVLSTPVYILILITKHFFKGGGFLEGEVRVIANRGGHLSTFVLLQPTWFQSSACHMYP